MSYTKNTWVKGDVITSAKLNNIEGGLETISTVTDTIQTTVTENSSALDTIKSKAEVNEENITTLKEQLTTVQTTLTTLASTISNLTAAVQAATLGVAERLTVLEDRVSSLTKTNVFPVENPTTSINDADKDIQLTGNLPVKVKSTFSGKTVSLSQVTQDSSHVNVTAQGEIRITNLTSKGNLARANTDKANGSNSAMSIETNDSIKITQSDLQQNGYNCLEIGLRNTAPKLVTIEDVKFSGTLSNNAILIFAQQDHAVITIKNCEFNAISNALRLSNRTNTHVTVNFIDCKFHKWDTDPTWAGAVILEDYTSNSRIAEVTNNLFGDGKVTINFVRCVGPYGEITAGDPLEQISSKLPQKQIVYVYGDSGGVYTSSKYPKMQPTVNII